jgi:hypothetical protein
MSTARAIQFGKKEYQFPSDALRPLRDSSDIATSRDDLLARLEEDGYLYLPGYLDREEVLTARKTILEYMAEHEAMEPGSRPLDGVMGQYGKNVGMMGKPQITHHPDVIKVLAAKRLYELHERIHNEPVTTFDYKWLRAVGNQAFTGCHMDYVYMGQGSKRLMTTWIPLADIPIEQGSLCICPQTHRSDEFKKIRETYGQMDCDRDNTDGWFSRDPEEISGKFGGVWHTSDVQAGDIITFGMHLMHASTTNTTDRWRLSCDVRFQPSADPIDPRWGGENPTGHVRPPDAPAKHRTMEEARTQWGL